MDLNANHPAESRNIDHGAATNPVVVELVRNGLVAAAEEMKSVLMRTACNMIIYEALDFTVGLFNARGETISIGLGLPMFIRGMSDTVKAKIAHYGLDGIEPGDVLLTNDAYITGAHLNHLTFSEPVFHDGKVVAFATCMAHWIDVGGVLNGMTTDIFAEGFQLPIVKYFRRGELNRELEAIIRMNVRAPESAMGDLRAQLAAVRTGVRHMEEMIAAYGCEAVLQSVEAILDHSAAAAQAQLAELPDGVYEATSFMDDDGVTLNEPVPLKVRVEIANGRMKVDLSGVADQVQGFYNSRAGRSAAQVAFRCLTAANDLPINDGPYRALDIELPDGKVVNAVRPAAMRAWMCYPMTVIDTIFQALAQAIPEKVIAGHHADLCVGHINGIDPVSGRMYLYLGGLIGGGWGAKQDEDGVNATIAINDGDTHNGPTEQVENKHPLLVESYRLRADSGGAGRQRGGLGTEHVCRVLAPINLNTRIDHVRNPPAGLLGGRPGAGNQVAVRRDADTEEIHPNGKLSTRVEAGQAFVIRSGGGGGFGPPEERDLARLREDVRQGYVTLEGARRDYGVTFSPESLTVIERNGPAIRGSEEA